MNIVAISTDGKILESQKHNKNNDLVRKIIEQNMISAGVSEYTIQEMSDEELSQHINNQY